MEHFLGLIVRACDSLESVLAVGTLVALVGFWIWFGGAALLRRLR